MYKIFLIILYLFCSSLSYAETGIDRSEIYRFSKKDKYFPTLIKQYQSLKFLWEDFDTYDRNVWGDNQSGAIEIITSHVGRTDHVSNLATFNGAARLNSGQMIWLLDRLNYGQVEFRWIKLGPPEVGTDKFIGFGDPNEGYCSGFRMFDNGKGVKLHAFVMNQGHFFVKEIPWESSFEHARFIIDWDKSFSNFIIITPFSSRNVAKISNTEFKGKVPATPKIRMEISVQNFSGKTPIDVELIKYDSYGF